MAEKIGVFLTVEQWDAVQIAIIDRMVNPYAKSRGHVPLLEAAQDEIDRTVVNRNGKE